MNEAVVSQEQPLKRLWWLHPTWVFAVVIGATVTLAIVQSEAAYQLYGTPKYIGPLHGLMALGAIAAFAFGRRVAEATGKVPQSTPESWEPAIRFWFYVATGLTLFGYGVWLLLAIKNGLNLSAVRELLSGTDPEFRQQVLATIPGVTTSTQFGVAAVILGTWLVLQGNRRVLLPLLLLVAMAAGRAVLNSERLALIEVLVPIAVVVVRMKVLGKPYGTVWRIGLSAAPLAGVLGMLVLFGSMEYFRSWQYYKQDFSSIAEFTVWRVGGYYTTAHNNGALTMQIRGQRPLPYATLSQFWEFPLVERSPIAYHKLTGIHPVEQHMETLERYGTDELNSEGGLFAPAVDYGLVGFAIFWLGYGFVAGRFYRGFLVGSLTGMTFYPLVFLSLLEVPRLLYLTNTRSFAPLAFFLMLLVLCRRWPTTVPTTVARAAA